MRIVRVAYCFGRGSSRRLVDLSAGALLEHQMRRRRGLGARIERRRSLGLGRSSSMDGMDPPF